MHSAKPTVAATRPTSTGRRSWALSACASLVLVGMPASAWAAPTEGTCNQAERPGISIVADAPTALAPLGGEGIAVRFRVSNGGNGAEVFTLAANVTGGVEGNGAVAGIAADEDDNGAYDPAIDKRLATTQLPLGAGQSKALFVLVGGTQQGSKIMLSASAAAGRGTPGTPNAGRSEGGGDIVVGSTDATAGAFTLLTGRATGPSSLPVTTP